MKTVLICHAGNRLTREGFARWLASFSDLVGIIEVREKGSRTRQRIRSELKRVGLFRFIFDVLPYRIYSRIVDGPADRLWIQNKIDELCETYPEIPGSTEILITESPNSSEARDFLVRLAPDMAIARCKTLINRDIYTIPPDGVLILHPGVCPEYRNAHGCFWALANNEPDKVGMTLLKIDAGIDTGPIYGYYSYPFELGRDTPAIIHNRVVYDNLDALKKKLLEVRDGKAQTIITTGRRSKIWGQPWLSKYLKLKRDSKGQ